MKIMRIRRQFAGGAYVAVLFSAVAVLALSPGNASAQGNIVVNGGFETPAVVGVSPFNINLDFDTKYAGANTLAPWVIGGNSINHVRSYFPAAEGLQSIDLNGIAPGSISQVLVTQPGRDYLLRFRYAENPNRILGNPRMTVRWGASANGPFTLQEQFTFTGNSTRTNMGWRVVERTVRATSTSTYLSFKSDDFAFSPFGIALDDVSATLLPNLATPSLIRAVATGGTSAYLIGRVDGAPSLPITLQAYAAPSCTDGVLAGGGTPVGLPVAVTTDPEGYFGTPATPVVVTPVTPGYFVAVKATAPVTTAMSACVASSADNDFWPKALDLGASQTARDYIDAPGKARWYKFDVKAGQRIQVSLVGLPADYDLAVFKDIGAAFLSQLAPANTAELTRLSAEYAPSVFSPSVFSPSVFSPSVFSPDAYAPSVFSPSVFSPSVFSPSVFSPSVFSPSVFSPSVFSPSVFSPSVFSPSVFSPSVFSPDEVAKAFSSAQTRSIIGVSATPGNVDESVVVNTWNNTGSFYVRVASRGGAFSTGSQFTVNVTKDATSCNAVTALAPAPRAPAGVSGKMTVIVTDSSKLPLSTPVPGGGTIGDKLAAFAARPDIAGVVVDVAGDARVTSLRAQADANPVCPYAKNLLAEEIKAIVDSYRPGNSGLRYVVIVGSDAVVPFFRYPDQSLLGQESGYVPPVLSNSASEASLRRDFVLGQDAYGSGSAVSLRTTSFPVPGLAVGRLVESASDIAGLIDAYVEVNGVVGPSSSLVTGYDFLEDAANAVRSELQSGTGVGPETLITPNGVSPQDPASWTAAQLGTKLLGARHDVVFLAGHFSANSALAADFTTSLLTTDLAASTTDFKNAIVFSAGCHSGYNLIDGDADVALGAQPLDWTQAFAQKKATLIAGTGYQYGDTDFIEYSERLYLNFARQLRAGTGTISVGEALVRAKQEYLATTPDIRGIHEKALLQATVFGLPMLGVNMPAGRGGSTGIGAPIATQDQAVAGPAAALGLKIKNATVAPTLNANSLPLKNLGGADVVASWLSGPEGVVSNPAEPALPLAAYNVTPTDATVLRGVGFRGGTYTDSSVVALTGAPTTELRGVHVPFVSPVFFPMRTWTVNYFGALAGTGGTSLLVTPVQHRAENIALGTSTMRRFGSLDLRLYYSGNLGDVSLSDAPTIVSIDAQPSAGGIAFTAQVVGDPKAAIHEVWITYTDGLGTWASLDLTQCVRAAPAAPLPAVCAIEDSRLWMGQLPTAPANLRYVVQAASGTGLVTLDDNRGLNYTVAGKPAADSALVLVAPPVAATFGDNLPITATLTTTGASPAPLPGKTVRIAIGGSARVGTTGANGNVTVNVPVNVVPGSYPITASFAGDEGNAASSTTGPGLSVSRATSSLSALPSPAVGATLTASIGGNPVAQSLLQEAVTFAVSGPGGSKTLSAITDYLGRAALPPTGLPPGSYAVNATFAGNATYTAAAAPLSLTIATQTITFDGGASLPASITHPGTAVFKVASGSGQPVAVTLSPAPNPHCTLSAAGNTYTLTTTNVPGVCTLVASAGETTTYASVSVTQNIAIKGDQAIVFATLPDKVYGNPPFLVAATGGASGNAVTFSSQTTAVCTTGGTDGTTVTIVSAGTCTIAADQAGDSLYNAAPRVVRSFTVNKAAQVITFAQPATPAVYGSTFPASGTADSGLAVSIAATGACTSSAGIVTMTSGTGTCTLTASQAGNANYLAAPDVVRLVQATPASQSITFAQPASPAAYNATFAVGSTSSSGLAVGIAASGVCTIASGTVTMTSGTGTCTLTASQPGNANFGAATPVVRTVLASKATQSITFPVITPTPKFVAGQAGTFTVSASSTSSLAVAFSALPATVCTVSGTTVTMKSAGLCTLSANQAGDGNYQPAPQVQQVVSIGKASQTITFAGPGDQVAGTSVTLSASASSGLAVSFAASLPATCTVAGNTLTLVAAGSCTITASQIGDANFEAAPDVVRVINVTSANLPNVWTKVAAPMTKKRLEHTATRFESGPLAGQVLIAGGYDRTGTAQSTAELYNPATRTFAATGSMLTKSAGHTATLLLDGKVLVIGGGNAKVQRFDPTTKTWSQLSTSMSSNRTWHTATRLPDGRVLVIGGYDSSGNTMSSTIVYDPAGSGSFTNGPTLDTPRKQHTATLLTSGPNTGKVLVVGGRKKSGSGYVTLATYQICGASAPMGPITCTSSAGGIAGRYAHAAVALGPSGTKVLIAGGTNGSSDLASAELYDSTTGTWAVSGTLGALSPARSDLTLSELPNGRALAVGGSFNGNARADADAYAPPIAAVADMWTPRAGHTATPLRDAAGNITGILVTGGADGDADEDDALDSAEIYGTP
ncbi:MAG: DUF642 domain-containing protein [Burkholderiales bacterium]